MLVDSHAHIYKENYDDIKDVVMDSKKYGVKKIINCSDNIETAKEVIDISKRYESFLYSSIGIHPHNVNKYNKKDIIELEKLIIDNNIIAIGEIGLDYFYDKNKYKQKKLFKIQLKLAEKYKLPVIVHSRNSNKDVYKLLRKYKVKGIVHCFSGNCNEANNFIKLGFLIGVGGIITFKKNNLKAVIKNIGLEYIVLETDSPYLTPEPFRKYKNEPKYIAEVAKKIADIKNIKYEDIIEISFNNLCRIFDFK